MGLLEIAIVMLVILGLIGVIIYFVYVYTEDKNTIDMQLSATSQQINDEQVNRLSNIKYVVDQVNSVNSDIAKQFASSNAVMLKSIGNEQRKINTNIALQQNNYKTLTNSIGRIQSNIIGNSSNIDKINYMVAGFGNYITYGQPSGTNSYNLMNLPSSPPANMNLMTQVNLLMGMTARNLSPSGSSNINFCYGPDSRTCTSFPNAAGDTVISAARTDEDGFQKGRINSIRLNGPTVTNNLTVQSIRICDNVDDALSCATLSADNNGNLIVNNKKLLYKTDSNNSVNWTSEYKQNANMFNWSGDKI